MKTSFYILIGLLILSIIGNVVLFMRETPKFEVSTEEGRIDTLIIKEIDYDTIFEPYYDTIHTTDTIVRDSVVYIRDVPFTYKYNTSDYDLEINAVKLNWHKLNYHRKDTFTLTVPQYVYIEREKKRFQFTHGLQLGLGYGLFNHKPDLYVGYGFQLKF